MAYGGAWRPPGKASASCTRHMCWLYVLAICIVGCLGHTRCKRGVALVKFQTFPISYGVTGRIYWPATKLNGTVHFGFYLASSYLTYGATTVANMSLFSTWIRSTVRFRSVYM